MDKNKKRSTFSGKLGFVLSAAGASVGLGNIWRFPYLAAKYGGGIFLLVYIILALTFGYTMIMAESSLGRMTRKSPVGAFEHFGKSKGFAVGGWINAIIPILIVPYYSVIGGWVIKYLVGYIGGQSKNLASDDYFSSFISNGLSTEICFLIFTLATLGIIYAGVRNGIERVSKFMMPILVVLSVIIAVYSVTRPGAIEGVKYFLVKSAQLDTSKDQLVVATNAAFEPFEYTKGEDYYGIDMEIASMLADELGQELVIQNMDFDAVCLSVGQHKCDIAMAGLTVNEERQEYVNFSDTYYQASQRLIVKADDTTFDDCKEAADVEALLQKTTSSDKIGVQAGTTAQYYIEGSDDWDFAGLPAECVQYKNGSLAVQDLVNGNLKYVIIDAAPAACITEAINAMQ